MTLANPIIGYNIMDRHTKAKVGFAKTRRGARISVDKRDNAYGAYRYGMEPVYGPVDAVLLAAIAEALGV